MRAIPIVFAMLLVAAPACAAPPEPGPLAVKVLETAVLPRYEIFARETRAQSDAWNSDCAKGGQPDLSALKRAYRTTAGSWNDVEWVSVGPISTSLRPDRIFGPDRRNYVAKALADLAAKVKAGEITPEAMRSISVAGQGFPALERVLYEPGDLDDAQRCRIGSAIARNLMTIASEIVAEWRAADGPLDKLKRGQGDPIHFADPAQAAARLMTDLAGGLQRLVDVKLLPVLGSGVEQARPKAAEGWRSGRSADSIRVGLASLAETAAVFSAAAPPDVAAGVAKSFEAAASATAKLPDDLGEAAADPKRRKIVEAAVAALKAAQRDVAKNLAPALGLPLGFNALDGD